MSRRKLHIVPPSPIETQERFKPDLSRMFVAPANLPREKVAPKVSPWALGDSKYENLALRFRAIQMAIDPPKPAASLQLIIWLFVAVGAILVFLWNN